MYHLQKRLRYDTMYRFVTRHCLLLMQHQHTHLNFLRSHLRYYHSYKHNNIWKAEDRFCFVTPVPKEEFYLEIPGVEQPLVGIIKYTNNKLLSYGIDVGDRVSFRPDAEYAVMLEGEKVYRVSSDWITMKI